MIRKICFFTSGFGFNRQTVLNSIEKIFPDNVEVFLFTPKDFNNSYKTNKIKIVKTSCNRFNAFFELRKFCKKNKIQRLANLGVLPQEGFVMMFASLLSKTDFISFQASDPITASKLSKGELKLKIFFETIFSYFLTFFTKKILFCSEDIYESYKKYYPLKNKSDYLNLLINTELFKPKNKTTTRKKLNLPLKKDIIIYVGRIEHLKGSDIIYKTIKTNQDKLFILIGDLADDRFKKNNLKDIKNLILLPSQNQEILVDYYNAADLCIFPSRFESYGFVPREAMSCSTPAIVSNILALRILKPAIKSELTDKIFSKEINTFFKLSPNEKDKLSKQSRQFIIDRYSEKALKKEYIKKLLN
ncbi:MAG: glycosyltransferase family 4 protein [archaeon]